MPRDIIAEKYSELDIFLLEVAQQWCNFTIFSCSQNVHKYNERITICDIELQNLLRFRIFFFKMYYAR